MPLFEFEGSAPMVEAGAWLAPTATLVGDVTVRAGASIWYGAVLRADLGPIVVGAGANIQDNSVLHTDGTLTTVGPGATVGHACVVHACTIGTEALIGNAATVQDGAVVGDRAMVAAGAVVLPGGEVPPETLAVGVPAKIRGPLTESAREWVRGNPAAYQELARRHSEAVREL
ncbi:carbonic anhydrase/acetyltransferase-like protein (isoleucine patch superfamily) [Lipingzhangella halophila]|uniref:Carbonic anhydrase/acetyltransferase-like protein (Isoleucine patch superfamily) n=1 Tax=Lipingzhangella halophila TaxID=1783352 RepID=A0A7W7W3U3_9ACTN|nr:gamma carbonic anhydrase family protein [Lipingzhangella halophila]MBB4933136.1 carbonic anhydrase/acetyltransferase-like protein (isoleucine patch superfamily) [Lipingzhangella halophila]